MKNTIENKGISQNTLCDIQNKIDYFQQVIQRTLVYIKKTKEWVFFLFENDQSNPDGINNNKVLRGDIEKLTGLKFK